MSLGIDLGSMFVPLCHQNQYLGLVFDNLGDGLFIDFDQKLFPQNVGASSLFPHLFDPVPQVVLLKVPWFTLAPFWSFVSSCWSFWVPFLINIDIFSIKIITFVINIFLKLDIRKTSECIILFIAPLIFNMIQRLFVHIRLYPHVFQKRIGIEQISAHAFYFLLFRCMFLHGCCMRFGIGVASMLASFCYQINICWRACF